MLIWILALLLLGVFALTGYTLGAIRMAGLLLGLLLGCLLAVPLGHLMGPVVGVLGIKNPFIIWMTGPFVAFVIFVIAGTIAGLVVDQKVTVHYKYNVGDIKVGLWNRLNPRLGLCIGAVNAVIYTILISWIIYFFSYATFQMVNGDNASWSVKMLNSAGKGLQSSGMVKVTAAIDSMPESYYQASDVLGMIYHNDLLEGRLSRYPGFLALGERPQFQDIANDKEFTELRQKQPPLAEILDNSKAQAIVNNPELLNEIWGIVKGDLKDLQTYLVSGKSEKYDGEAILGRWDFDLNGSLNQVKRNKPTIAFQEMQRTKELMTLIFSKTTLVAIPEPDKQVILKAVGKLRPAAKPNQMPGVDEQSFKGQWLASGSKYDLTFADKNPGSMEATVDGDHMTISGDTYPMVFTREY